MARLAAVWGLIVLIAAVASQVHAAWRSQEAEKPVVAPLMCECCRGTVEHILEMSVEPKKRTLDRMVELLDDPKAICDVKYFEQGSAQLVDGEITYQKFKWPPPDMERGCETFLGDHEDAIIRSFLKQGDMANNKLTRQVCYEETTACAAHGGATTAKQVPLEELDGKASTGSSKKEGVDTKGRDGDGKASKGEKAAGESVKQKEKDSMKVHRKRPDTKLSPEEQKQQNARLLHAAAVKEDVETVKRALEDGANINAVSDQMGGRTALMAACLSGYAGAVRVLLANGADWTIPEKDGYTCLHGAGFQGRAAVATAALKAGLPPNDVHADGYMPIHRAAWGASKGHADTVRALARGGAYVDVTANGKTALHLACRANTVNFELVKALVESGADVNGLADDGKSPLLMLLMGGPGDEARMNAVTMVVKYGADLSHADSESGQTVADIAKEFGYEGYIKEALKEEEEMGEGEAVVRGKKKKKGGGKKKKASQEL